MKNRTLPALPLFALLAASLALSSCIKDEALNAEADITGVTLGDSSLIIRSADITNNEVTVYANTADSILAPQFSLTPGATISPASGTRRQFFTRRPNPEAGEGQPDSIIVSTPQQYTVTSEDGKWHKTYTVSIVNNATPSDYHFDNIRYYSSNTQDSVYQIFYETIGGNRVDWGSGNPGVAITFLSMASHPTAADYPTSQAPDGVSGACAKLTTVSTGAVGRTFGAPIAAGNIFLGTFAVRFGKDMPKSTHFGIPLHNTRPTRFSGYYKYKAGETVTDENFNPVDGLKDDFSIYAVVYEVTGDVPWLDGDENAKTSSLHSPNIVLKAELTDRKETDTWTRFDIPFEETTTNTFDKKKLEEGRYNIAIICSSSKNGHLFEGAVGSTLYIDEFHITYE